MNKIFLSIIFCFVAIHSTVSNDVSPTMETYYKLAWDHMDKDFDSSLYYSEKLERMAKSDNNSLMLGKAYYTIGYANFINKYYDKSARNYLNCIKLIEHSKDKNLEKIKAYSLQNLGLVYEKTYNYDEAIKYYEQALEIASDHNIKITMADLNYNLGVCYRKKSSNEDALKYYQRALKIYSELENHEGVSDTYNLLGILYSAEGEYDLAKSYYEKAIKISEEHNTPTEKRIWHISNIGEAYFLQNQFDTAKIYYDQALAISQKLNDKEKIKWLNNNLGDVYFKEKNYEKAIACYNESIKLGHTGNIDEELKRSYQNIAKAYDAQGNYQLASQFKDKYMGQAELLAQTRDKLQEQNAQYRMREVEWQMERLAKNEQIQFYQTSVFWFRVSISLILLVLVMISYFTYKYYRKIALARRLLNY